MPGRDPATSSLKPEPGGRGLKLTASWCKACGPASAWRTNSSGCEHVSIGFSSCVDSDRSTRHVSYASLFGSRCTDISHLDVAPFGNPFGYHFVNVKRSSATTEIARVGGG